MRLGALVSTPFWYNAILALLKPFYRWRIKKRSENKQQYQLECQQRFGHFLPVKHQHAIWIHAVSVGETNAIQPVVDHYLQQGYPILFTNTTKTGQARAKHLFLERYQHLIDIVYLPVDQRKTIQHFLQHYQPRLLALVETELWANLLDQTHQQGIPSLLLNARLSQKSAKAYAKISGLTQGMLHHLNQILAQDSATQQRFIELGMSPERIHVVGNIKFDMSVPKHFLELAQQLKQDWQLAQRHILLLASTHAPEEQQILTTLKPYLQQSSQLLCIVVPRHPERFDEVMQVCTQLNLTTHRRSQHQTIQANTQVYLADSMGEMWLWYALSQSCFVGGSLNDTGGGHNILEPMLLNVPTITGKKYFNFQHIVDELLQEQAIKIAENTDQVVSYLLLDIQQPQQAQIQVERARQVVQRNQGSLQRHIEAINTYLNIV